MKIIAIMVLIVAAASAAFGAYPCGLKNDNTLYLPPNYPRPFSPPALYGNYVDPITSCTATRLTNGVTQNAGRGIHIIYSNSAWMSDDDLYVLVNFNPNGEYGVLDRAGNVIVPLGNMPNYSPATSFIKWAGPSGSGKALSGHDLYYTQSSDSDSMLYRGSFVTACAPTCSMNTPQMLHAFTGYAKVTFVGGEADVSADGDHVVLDGCTTNTIDPCTGTETIFFYQLSTDTIVGTFNMTGHNIDGIQILPDNRLIFNWSAGGTRCPTEECFYGSSLYTSSLAWVHQIWFRNNHFVTASDGVHQYEVAEDANIGVCPNYSGLTVIDVDSLVATCIMNLIGSNGSHTETAHVSAARYSGWSVISFYDDHTPRSPMTDSYPMGSYATLWRPHWNEEVLVNLVTGDFYNIIQTRTCPFSSVGVDYWKLAFGSLSRDGRYLLYNTDFCHNSARGYSDVMVIDLGNSNQ
jgi:hypothetical protein